MTMEFLEILKRASGITAVDPETMDRRLRITLVTNITDDLFKKLLTGLCLAENVYPEIQTVPYKQYLLALKQPDSDLRSNPGDVVIFFFDATPYRDTEFHRGGHMEELLAELRAFCTHTSTRVIGNTMIVPSKTVHGNAEAQNALHASITQFNAGITELANHAGTLHVLDVNRIVRNMGERTIRDLRGLYAFDQPFTHTFIQRLAEEWMAYLRALLGRARKCIVVDLDNTLWGGVVGEVGVQGIALGTEYPGNAYRQFQQTLREFYDRGVILAINSRNNPEEVEQVFAQHPHMILRPEHFAAMMINWNDKAENIKAIANELNIGLDSMVFLDDDAANRALVREALPRVLVPEFSLAPEQYAATLLDLNAFHQLQMTEEDKERGRMYAEERRRKEMQTASTSVEDYLARLNIELTVWLNDAANLPRLAQLTLKTNQFNLTTHRYTETDIRQFLERDLVFSADVRDAFGPYGITLEAIVSTKDETTADLDTFLMSCRVMGRRVEQVFFHTIVRELHARRFTTLTARMIPTAKNTPIQSFLSTMGGAEIREDEDGTKYYTFQIDAFLKTHRTAPYAPLRVNYGNPNLFRSSL
jgi:FkbH-like protein